MDDLGPNPASGRPVWFVGNLDDPWVASVADAIPSSAAPVRWHCPGDLPDGFATPTAAPAVVVLHRSVLTRHDFERVARLRAGREPPPRVVLCFGPHARYDDLARWSELVDAALPEATARDTLARRLVEPEPAARRSLTGGRPRVAVVSTNHALRQVLAEGCEAAGYPVAAARDWMEAPLTGPAVWDVPVLEPGWPQELSRRARGGPVVALIGFADRTLVAEARARGASACLELPVDLADLSAVLDRLTAPRAEPAHDVPPPPASRRRPGTKGSPTRAVADGGREA